MYIHVQSIRDKSHTHDKSRTLSPRIILVSCACMISHALAPPGQCAWLIASRLYILWSIQLQLLSCGSGSKTVQLEAKWLHIYSHLISFLEDEDILYSHLPEKQASKLPSVHCSSFHPCHTSQTRLGSNQKPWSRTNCSIWFKNESLSKQGLEKKFLPGID